MLAVPHWAAPVTTALLAVAAPLFAFVIQPLLDLALGEEELSPRQPHPPSFKPFYSGVCQVAALLHLTVVGTAIVSAAAMPTPGHIFFLALNCAVAGGFGFCVAHELVHSSSPADRFMAQILLTALCYKHWSHSHIAHHIQVATPEDPATARYREAVYPFVLRSIRGNWSDACRMEWKRMEREMPSVSALTKLSRSRIVGWVGWPAAVAATAWAVTGPVGAFMYLLAGAGSVFFLEVVNYIEHYGLHRQWVPALQRFESVGVQHSWNANTLFSNSVLLQLQRHTDHHMHAARPYYELESVEGAPKLPASYSAMIMLALIPPWWFAVMNPRVHVYAMLAQVRAPKAKGTGGEDEAASPGMPLATP